MEGRLWRLWVLCGCCSIRGGVGQLLPAAFPAAGLCPLPSRNTRKKSLMANQERIFFLPVMKQANGAACSCLPWPIVSSTLSFLNDL